MRLVATACASRFAAAAADSHSGGATAAAAAADPSHSSGATGSATAAMNFEALRASKFCAETIGQLTI